MKKLKVLIIPIFFASFLTSCIHTLPGDLNPLEDTEETFFPDDFNSIDVGYAFDVEVVPSSEFKVTLVGNAKDVENIRVRVINNNLKISYRTGSWVGNWIRHRVDVLIETPETLEEIDISGAAEVKIEDFSSFEDFKADLSGASKLYLDVSVDKLKIDISGASKLTMNQSAPLINADLSGASRLEAFDANSEEVYLQLSGASRANVRASEYLSVEASGASTVNYKGTPRTDLDVSGGSKVSNKTN